MAKKLTVSNGSVATPAGNVALPSPQALDHHESIRFIDSMFRPEMGYVDGYQLERDDHTLIMRVPSFWSNEIHRICDAIADGNVGNIGISPFPFGEINGVIMRQQAQASSADFVIEGRSYPATRAREAISRFDDSPVGYQSAIRTLVRNLRTYNKGQPLLTLPLTYPTADWQSLGMTMKPIGSERDGLFTVDVNWAKLGYPVPFIPSVYDLLPTGNSRYPYWYRVKIDKRDRFVLLDSEQIIPLIPSPSSRPGVGVSAVYGCLSFLCELILVIDERIEKLVNLPAEGILGISGSDLDARALRGKIGEEGKARREEGHRLDRGYTILTNRDGKISFDYFSFRQSDGIDHKARQERNENMMALFFGESLSTIIPRPGVGYSAQAEVSAETSAEVGVGSLLDYIASALGAIYKRVRITPSRANDKAQRLNVTTFGTFAAGVKALADAGAGLTAAQVHAIIHRDFFSLPSSDSADVTTNTDPSAGGGDTAESPNKDGAASNGQPADRPSEKLAQQLSSLTPVFPHSLFGGDPAMMIDMFFLTDRDAIYAHCLADAIGVNRKLVSGAISLERWVDGLTRILVAATVQCMRASSETAAIRMLHYRIEGLHSCAVRIASGLYSPADIDAYTTGLLRSTIDAARTVVFAAPKRKANNDRALTLRPRENEVLQLLAKGLTNRQIADQLVISVRTVEKHIEWIVTKIFTEDFDGDRHAARNRLVDKAKELTRQR